MSRFTSIAAHIGMRGAITTLQDDVLLYIRRQGEIGATDEEITMALHMNPSTQRPRRIELENEGRIYTDGELRTTISGRYAFVFKARRGRAKR